MRQRMTRLAGATALALAVLVGSHAALGNSAAQAAPLDSVQAQYPDIHGGGTVTVGGPGYAHGYGDGPRYTYGNGLGTYYPYLYSPGTQQVFAPTTPAGVQYAPVQYYHDFHPGPGQACVGVYPC